MTVKECHFGTEKPIAPAKTYRSCLTRGQKSTTFKCHRGKNVESLRN